MKNLLHTLGILFVLFSLSCSARADDPRSKPMQEDQPAKEANMLTSTPHIISRVEWEAKTPNYDLMKLHRPDRITLHHGGVKHDPNRDSYDYMRALQSWCLRDRPWCDIPYHYVINMQGKIFEARNDLLAGDTNTEYDPTGHLLIDVVGNYEEQVPNQAQLDAVVQLMAFLCRKYDVSPDTIASHKDYSKQTSCPGKNLYKYIENGYFIREVTQLLEREGYLKESKDSAPANVSGSK